MCQRRCSLNSVRLGSYDKSLWRWDKFRNNEGGFFLHRLSLSLSFLFLFSPPPTSTTTTKKKKRSSSNASDWKMLHLSEYGGVEVEADKKGHLQLQIANKRNVPHHLHYCSSGPEFFQFFICFFQVFLFVFFMIGLLFFFFFPSIPGGEKDFCTQRNSWDDLFI